MNCGCCKSCTKRKQGCHSTCAEYLEYKKKTTEEREKRLKWNLINCYKKGGRK